MAEAPILWPSDENWLGKDPDSGKDWRQEEKGTAEDEVVGWHHGFNGHEFEQSPGDSEGEGKSGGQQSRRSQRVDITEWPKDKWLKGPSLSQEVDGLRNRSNQLCPSDSDFGAVPSITCETTRDWRELHWFAIAMCQAFPMHCLIKCSKIKGTYHRHLTLPSGSGSSEVMCLKTLQWYLQSQDLKRAWLDPSAHAFLQHPVKQPEGKGRVGSAALRASGGGRELNLLGFCGHLCPHQPGMEGCSPFTKDSCCFSTPSWKKLQAALECAVETLLGTQLPSEYVSQQHFVFSNCWLDDQGSFPLLLEKEKNPPLNRCSNLFLISIIPQILTVTPLKWSRSTLKLISHWNKSQVCPVDRAGHVLLD